MARIAINEAPTFGLTVDVRRPPANGDILKPFVRQLANLEDTSCTYEGLMKPLVPKPEQPGEVRQAFRFARELASDEIKSIERLHQRTILSLFAIVSLFGFIGYSQLRSIVTSQINTQVHAEVHKQVTAQIKDQLQREHVQEVVSAIVRQMSEAEITKLVHGEIGISLEQSLAKELPTATRLEVKRDLPGEVNRALTEAHIPTIVQEAVRGEVDSQQKSIQFTAASETRKILQGHVGPGINMTGTYRTIYSALLSSGQKGKIVLFADGYDIQTVNLAFAINQAGWTIDLRDTPPPYPPLPSTFLIVNNTGDRSKQLARTLFSALQTSFEVRTSDKPPIADVDPHAVVLIFPSKSNNR